MAWDRATRNLMAVIMPSTLSASKIPADACGVWTVDGVRVEVFTVAHVRAYNLRMRVYATCPTCGKVVSYSRLKQHNKAHAPKAHA